MSAPSARTHSFVIMLGLMTAVAALTVDLSLPAVPSMVEALATNLSVGQLIVGVFMAGMALGQIPAGLVSDRIGRLPVLYVGMSLFAAAAMVAAVATNIELLLAARLVQGFGAAAAVVLSRAIVRDIATGKEAARLMSLMTMIFPAAPVIAPSFGALLVSQWGWRAPFIVIAIGGLAIIGGIRASLTETHTPRNNGHPLQQLLSSFAEFFSHRQSIFGLLLIILPPAGFMSVITVSAASFVNRMAVAKFDLMHLISLGAGLIGLCAIQLLIIVALDHAPLWWLWGCVCLFMFSIGILLPNAMVLALDPLPRIAGVASSIIGTIQNIFGAAGAIGGAMLYNGSVRNTVIIMASVGVVTVVILLLRPLIVPGPIYHHPDELARD